MTTLTTEPDRIDLDDATGACIVRLREERDVAVAALRDRDATIARLTSAVREYLAAEASHDAASRASMLVVGDYNGPEVEAAGDRIVAASNAQNAARAALAALVGGAVEADAFRRGAEAMRAAAIAACVKQSNEMFSTAGALGCDFCEDAIEDLPLPEVTK